MVEGVVHSGEQNVISTVNWFGLYMEDFLMTMKVLRRFFQTASTRSNNMNNIIVQLYMGSSTSGLSSGKLAFPDRVLILFGWQDCVKLVGRDPMTFLLMTVLNVHIILLFLTILQMLIVLKCLRYLKRKITTAGDRNVQLLAYMKECVLFILQCFL
ncbi:uncharacterized protein [Triticum aestivum]|uniref:uncharacterized protein isoform X2 n=1 Tax=Triticum aestivum TaxID=4565 RepID=UPI001D0102CD|nr:uncharacterized protein LOC123136232 isoform X2 [Triticum aestivum]